MKGLFNGAATPETTKASAQENYFAERESDDFGLEEVKQVLVVSDLHLGEGQLHPDSIYWDRLENFTSDEEFEEFLNYKQRGQAQEQASLREKDWPVLLNGGIEAKHKLLVINGDFIDFLRIVRTPRAPNLSAELTAWQNVLDALPLSEKKRTQTNETFTAFRSHWEKHSGKKNLWQKLRDFFSLAGRRVRREKKYGFNTEDYKTIHRLEGVSQGHRTVFDALRRWLDQGSALAFVSGNHDQEMDQELVRAWFRYKLNAASGKQAERLRFFSEGVQLWNRIRIEHGQRYEWHTKTRKISDKKNPTQSVELPPGSLFNRYFVNRIETEAPYLDNVRPVTRVVAYLLRYRTLETLGMLWQLLRTVAPLLFSFKPRVQAFIGYSVLAAGHSLFNAANYVGWAMLVPLAVVRAFRLDFVLGLAALVLAGVFVWQWNVIAKRATAGLLRSRGVLRIVILLAVGFGIVLPPAVQVIKWLYQSLTTSAWDFLAVLDPFAPVTQQGWWDWVRENFKSPQWDLLRSFWPAAALTLIAWGTKFLTQALRPHFDKETVREKMMLDWPASPAMRFATCGHTHIPDKETWAEENAVYLNSGTWTQVFEYDTDVVRDDLTKTFVEFYKDKSGEWQGELRRWEPPKIRENKVVLLEPRNMKTAEVQAEVLAAA